MLPTPTEEHSYFKFEPARVLAAFTLFGAAILAFLPFFFEDLTTKQLGGLQALFSALCAFLGAFIVRGATTANVNVALTKQDAKELVQAGFQTTGPADPAAPPPNPGQDLGQVPSNLLWTVVGILLAIVLVIWLVRQVR